MDLCGRAVGEPQRVAASLRGMVATAHHCATDAGREILAAGANAIDAAVAASLALGITRSMSRNLLQECEETSAVRA